MRRGYDTSDQIRARLIREGIEPHPGPPVWSGPMSRTQHITHLSRKQLLRIGTVNIRGMHGRDAHAAASKLNNISAKDLLGKIGWLEAHDIAVLVDTKNEDPKGKHFNNFEEVHCTADPLTKCKGVTIAFSSKLTNENESSLDWMELTKITETQIHSWQCGCRPQWDTYPGKGIFQQ